MDDFTYDCMVKKRIASGDRHKKRGSKSKKCTLSSDYLTEAQWKKKNGALISMNLDKPIDWKTFREWPSDICREYIQRMVNTYHCTMSDLAEFFEVTPPPVRRFLGQIQYPMGQFQKGRRMSREDKEALNLWKRGEASPAPTSAAAAEPVAHEAHPAPAQGLCALMSTPHMEMDFVGTINSQQITNTILAVAGRRKVHLRVIVDAWREEGDTVCTT